MLCWVDCETTGLEASKEKVLEIACVITDDALVEHARFQRVTTEAKHHDLSKVDPTISFDRAFMQAHLPRAHALLHYRNVDVSTLNELAKRFWPEVFEKRPRSGESKHRALDDVLESLEVARYYVRAIGPVAIKEAA